MSELKRNLATNFRRYTDGRNKIEYIVKIAMYTALSFVLYAFVKFPLPFAFPGFLDIQISELPALIAGFSMGPVSGCLVIVLKCLLKFPLSTTQFVGEATDILLGICFVLPSSLIYNCRKNKKNAAIGLVAGSIIVTLAAIIVNRFISIPFYVTVMFGGSYEPIINMLKPLYKTVTRENLYAWYLGVGVLPFNILRCIIVSVVTFLLYPRLKRPLKLETAEAYPDKYDLPTQGGAKDGNLSSDGENAEIIGKNNDLHVVNDDEDIAKCDEK